MGRMAASQAEPADRGGGQGAAAEHQVAQGLAGGVLQVLEVDRDHQMRNTRRGIGVPGRGLQNGDQRVGVPLVTGSRIQLAVNRLVGFGELVDRGLEQFGVLRREEPAELDAVVGALQPQLLALVGGVLGRFGTISVQRVDDPLTQEVQIGRRQVPGGFDHLLLGDLNVFDRDGVGDLVESADDRGGLVQVQHHRTRITLTGLAVGLGVVGIKVEIERVDVGVGVRVGEGGGDRWVFGEVFGEVEVSFDVFAVEAVADRDEFGGVAGTGLLSVAGLVQAGQACRR